MEATASDPRDAEAVWREMMAELAGRDAAEPLLLVANDGEALVRLSLMDQNLIPLGITRLVGDHLAPLRAEDVAAALNGRGWIAPRDGITFHVTDVGRSA